LLLKSSQKFDAEIHLYGAAVPKGLQCLASLSRYQFEAYHFKHSNHSSSIVFGSFVKSHSAIFCIGADSV